MTKINPADDDKNDIINEKNVICLSWKMFFHGFYTSGYNKRNHCWMKNSLQTFIITKLLLMKNQFVALTRNKSSIRKIILSDRILSCCRNKCSNKCFTIILLFYLDQCVQFNSRKILKRLYENYVFRAIWAEYKL